MGNDAAYKTVRIGYVIIKLHDGTVRTQNFDKLLTFQSQEKSYALGAA